MYINHPSKKNQLFSDDGSRDNREAVVSQQLFFSEHSMYSTLGRNFPFKVFFWFTSFLLKRQASNSLNNYLVMSLMHFLSSNQHIIWTQVVFLFPFLRKRWILSNSPMLASYQTTYKISRKKTI